MFAPDGKPGQDDLEASQKGNAAMPLRLSGQRQQGLPLLIRQVNRNQGKHSGSLLDQIDLHIDVPSLPAQNLLNGPPGESTEAIAAGSLVERQRAMARQGHTNDDLHGQALDTQTRVNEKAAALLQKAAAKLG